MPDTYTPGHVVPGDVLNRSSLWNDLVEHTIISCTSTTRPTSPQHGMTVFETDTGNYMTWSTPDGFWMPLENVLGLIDPGGDVQVGTAPANIRSVKFHQFKRSVIGTVSNTSGGLTVPWPITFPNGIYYYAVTPGDISGPLGFLTTVGENVTLGSWNGVAYQPDGTVVDNGTNVRVNFEVVGC